MIRRHPSSAQLRRWLEANALDGFEELDAHIDECERCAAKLEQLAAHEGDEGLIAQALAAVLEPAEGLSARVEGGVVDRLGSRQMAVVFGDLLGAAFETSKLLLTEEDL